MKTALVITAYKTPEILARTLKNYFSQKRYPDELIIAEDGRDLNLEELLPSPRPKRFRIIHIQQDDKGYRRSAIINKAILSSDADYIIISDSDCIPHYEFINDHLRFRKSGQIVTATRAFVDKSIVPVFNRSFISIVPQILKNLVYPKKVALRIPWVNWKSNTTAIGANMAFWKKDFVSVNGFDESFEGWGHEDLEFLSRLENQGLGRIFLHQQCILYHLNHPILARDNSETNQKKLDESIELKKTWCDNGYDRYSTDRKMKWIKEIIES